MENDEEDAIQMQYSANTEREFRRMNGYLDSIGEAIWTGSSMGFTVVSLGKYPAGGPQSGCIVNLTSAQYI